ncbi:hypothetical protein V2J09_006829 [Rumex salicifolius]
MECNNTNATTKHLTYGQFPEKFVWLENSKTWKIREKKIYHASPGSGERYYLRILLNHIKGPTSYEELRTIEGVNRAMHWGLLDDVKEYVDGITEASFWGSTDYVRSLFVFLLISDNMSRPDFVWECTWKLLAYDVANKQRNLLRIVDLQLSDVQLQNYALAEIKNSLKNLNAMPTIDQSLLSEGVYRLILEELRYDKASLAGEHKELISSFTHEKKGVYDEGLVFYGYGGTRNFFLWRALLAAIRVEGEIMLTVASSENATLLIPSGRIAHSWFIILLQGNEDSLCHIGDDNDEESQTEIPDELLVKTDDLDSIPTVIKSIYPFKLDNQVSPKYFEERVILAPTHEEVDKVNDFILSLLLGDEKSLCKAVRHSDNDESIYTSDYLNTIRCSGVPNYVLKLKLESLLCCSEILINLHVYTTG